jgi:hypothetical protein
MTNGTLPPASSTPQPPLTSDQFRAIFSPTFSDPVAYPDATIDWWLSMAPVDPCIWGQWYQLGQGLWTAHELAKLGPVNADIGGQTGLSLVVSSKGVGPVSVSYDNSLGAEEGAGQYNMTIYGRQYIHYARLMGAGPIQVGAVTIPPYGTNFSWLGPPPIPGWFG